MLLLSYGPMGGATAGFHRISNGPTSNGAQMTFKKDQISMQCTHVTFKIAQDGGIYFLNSAVVRFFCIYLLSYHQKHW